MDSKDTRLLRTMAILVIAGAAILAASPAQAGVFDWLGWQYGWDMCWWH